jgi:glycosyltransferase involved in cell wall biosynthesis
VTWQSLSIVLPAYNEEAVIAETIQDCLRAVHRFAPNAEIIIVDDGSKDNTGAIIDQAALRDARVVAVHNRPNQGYGGALLAGFAAARGELLFFMDSDNQFDIMGIAPFLQVAVRNPGSAVLGYRRNRKDSFMRKLNAWGWKQVVRSQLRVRGIKDIDCAFKLFPTRAIQSMGLTSRGAMINAELLFKLQKMHVPIVQMPVHHYIRTKGKATGANLAVIRRAFAELRQLGKQLRQWQPSAQ